MFKAQLVDSTVWKKIFESINAIVTETAISVNEQGLTLMAMDTVHVTMISLTLVKDDFEVFEIPAKEEYVLGINTTDLLKMLKRADNTDIITLEFVPEERKLVLKMSRLDSKKSKKFSLSLIDLDATRLPLAQLMEIPLNSIIDIKTKFIHEALNDAEIYTEAIRIITSSDSITFKSEGSIGEMEYVLEKEEFIVDEQEYKLGVSEGTFTINKLKSILKISSLVESVNLGLASDAPARLLFNLMEHSKIIYFLAPRVDQTTEEY